MESQSPVMCFEMSVTRVSGLKLSLKGIPSCCLHACRSPRHYFAVYDGLEATEPDGRRSHFELISCRCVDTYVQLKGNQNQICWKWKKVRLHASPQ